MKLTPLDIHHKEFGHSLRGYNEEQVDQFLDEVADEFERLFKENIGLSEKLDAAQARLSEFESQRDTINNTLLAAQRSADDIAAKAKAEADAVVRDAEVKAKEIIHNALEKKQRVAGELVRIKQAEEAFRAQYKTLLETNLRSVSEIALPDDVDVLLGETGEGVVGDVAVRSESESAAGGTTEAAASTHAPAPAEAAVQIPEELVLIVPDEQPVPQPGFVQSVQLGELGAPDIEEDLTFREPAEFPLPRLDALGERDDDSEIEEID